MRILSLLPSATEIVCALGLGDRLVGRSHSCDFPPGVEALPVCTRTKIHTHVDSQAIHEDVTALLSQALGLYEVQTELVRSLRPTHIVSQTQCEVCAVTPDDLREALNSWGKATPDIVSLSALTLEGVFDDILRAAQSLNVENDGLRLVAEMKTQIDAIATRARRSSTRPRVVCIEWLDPLMAAGNWMPELVKLAGGQELIGSPGRHSHWIAWEDLVSADPEVIILCPCGFSIEKTRDELPSLTSRPFWRRLQAVRTGAVFIADGHHYFNRPGPRLVDTLQILAEILHPARFSPRLEGTSWERVGRGTPAAV